jgi:hypothetical protein
MLYSRYLRGASYGALAAIAYTLVGCSIRPLPEEVTRKDTYHIVEKIRCEAQEGLRGVPLAHPILRHTYIGYDFTFDITENNDAAEGKLEFTRQGIPSADRFTLAFTGEAKRERKNKRDFRIVESFENLNNADCSIETTRRYWKYPIAGAVGMDEAVRTYIRVEKLTNFVKTDGTPGTLPVGTGSDPIVFSDDLKFTTELIAGVRPTLQLAAVVGSFRVTNATIFAQAKRKDIHQVTVAMARKSDAVVDVRVLDRISGGFVGPRISRGLEAVAQRDADAPTRVLFEL